MALQIALVGLSLVGGGPGATGAGVIVGPGAITQYGDGLIVSILGDLVSYHGPPPHDIAMIVTGSPDTFCDGKPLVRATDMASCGCTVLEGDYNAFCL